MNPSAQNRPNFEVYDHAYQAMPKLVPYKPLVLFVEEIIDYSMRKNNLLNWIPPMNIEYLRLRHADKRYFDYRIGEAISHSCTESDAVTSALNFGFNENAWLTLNPEDARKQLIWFLGLMLMHTQVPKDFAAFQIFSFCCYLGRAAMKRQQNILANEVVHTLVHTCCIHFPYEKQYVEYLTKAERYNLVHRHNHH